MREANIVGKKVRIIKCEGREHGSDQDGCICFAIGKVVLIGKELESWCVTTPKFYIQGTDKVVRRSEVKLVSQRLKTYMEQPPLGLKVVMKEVHHGAGERQHSIYATLYDAKTNELTMSATLEDILDAVRKRAWILVRK